MFVNTLSAFADFTIKLVTSGGLKVREASKWLEGDWFNILSSQDKDEGGKGESKYLSIPDYHWSALLQGP